MQASSAPQVPGLPVTSTTWGARSLRTGQDPRQSRRRRGHAAAASATQATHASHIPKRDVQTCDEGIQQRCAVYRTVRCVMARQIRIWRASDSIAPLTQATYHTAATAGALCTGVALLAMSRVQAASPVGCARLVSRAAVGPAVRQGRERDGSRRVQLCRRVQGQRGGGGGQRGGHRVLVAAWPDSVTCGLPCWVHRGVAARPCGAGTACIERRDVGEGSLSVRPSIAA